MRGEGLAVMINMGNIDMLLICRLYSRLCLLFTYSFKRMNRDE